MDLHNDALKALEFPPKEDKRDFGNLDEERSTKEEDILSIFFGKKSHYIFWVYPSKFDGGVWR